MAKRKNQHEHGDQVAVFQWAAYFPALKWMHCIPNGAHLAGDKLQRAKQMARLKAEGLKPGILDICLPLPVPPYHGLYMEMKHGDNTLSKKQSEFLEYAERNGYKCAVCYSAKEAIQTIKEYANI